MGLFVFVWGGVGYSGTTNHVVLIHVCKYVCTFTNLCMYVISWFVYVNELCVVYVCMYVCMYVCIYIYIYIHSYISLSICMYIYIYTPI